MSSARRTPRWMLWTGAILAVALIALGIYLLVPRGNESSPSAEGEGSSVQLPAGEDKGDEVAQAPHQEEGAKQQILLEEPPSKQEIQDMNIKKLDGDLVAKSVGLSVGLSEMSEVNNTINPPGLNDAYVVRGHGKPGSRDEGTTYIALHSVQGAAIPGNKLIDVDAEKSTMKEGDSIQVKGSKYSVTKAFTVSKEKLPDTPEVWEEKDGKLVIITCLQRSQGRSLQNVVIEAQLN